MSYAFDSLIVVYYNSSLEKKIKNRSLTSHKHPLHCSEYLSSIVILIGLLIENKDRGVARGLPGECLTSFQMTAKRGDASQSASRALLFRRRRRRVTTRRLLVDKLIDSISLFFGFAVGRHSLVTRSRVNLFALFLARKNNRLGRINMN